MKHMVCLREFTRYASLNVLGMLGLSCYILADTFFVAKGLGADGLAALNIAIPVYSLVHGVGLMIGMGGGTQYSHLKHQSTTGEASRIFTHSLLLAAIFAAVFFAAGLFLPEVPAHLMGAEGEVYRMSVTYTRVILLFAPAFILNNVLLCFVRNDGFPQLAMAAMLGGSLSNVVLDYVFIFPCGMGIFGAVLATGLAPLISMLILLPPFIKRLTGFHIQVCVLSRKLIGTLLSSGFPSLITEVSSALVIIVFNILILRFEGTVGIAAYGVIANLSLVVLAVYTGIAQGIQPLLCSQYGAGERGNINLILRYALISMIAVSVAVYALVFFGARQITGIFNSARNPLLQSIAENGLKRYFTGCLFAGFNIIISVYFTSTSRFFAAHLISLLRGFALILPLAFLLSALWGMNGIWCAFPVAELLTGITGLVLFRCLHPCRFTVHHPPRQATLPAARE